MAVESLREAAGTAKWALSHPLTAAVAVGGSLASWVFGLPVGGDLAAWLIESSGTLFGAASVSAFTLGPQIEWLPADALQQVAIGLGVVFVGAKLHQAGKGLLTRFRS
jgi:hypothetical protein